jgi:MFS family permease
MFRNPSLAALFILAVLGGFAMFSLLFYTPLLFQGGFGMSPKDAGLVITPLVVCTTVGSIVNGRLVTRLPNANGMLYAGFALLALSCLGVVISTHLTSRGLLMTYMLMGGVGLGFVMPNLTVFAQETAGREHLGIATALLQSLRMIGGMLGTALTGALVDHMYVSGVRQALAEKHATQWFRQFSDPQILINHDAQVPLLAQLAHAGHDGLALLEQARESLVGSIHFGLALAAVVTFLALWLVRRVPPIRLTHVVEPTIMAE